MAKLEFEDIDFELGADVLSVRLFRIFSCSIGVNDLTRIGRFEVRAKSIEFKSVSDKEAGNKFMPLLSRALASLSNTLTKNPAVYVHSNSGIPLVGTLYFGIVDRGTNILELKPITGCNINCEFCSVNEGSKSKMVDFVVEPAYLVQEVGRILEIKDAPMDIFINTHGEPLLYAPICELVQGLRKNPLVRAISIITNGTLLNKEMIDKLVEAGLSQLNISLNAIDPALSKKLAGTQGYDVSKVMDSCRYASKKLDVIIAPVWIKGLNDEEMPKIINFSKEINAKIGIQNYMVHKMGKKVAKQVEWDDFYAQLKKWEEETGVSLKFEGHSLSVTRPLEKPFKKGDIIKAEIVCKGRLKNEMIAACKGRSISILSCTKDRGTINAKIVKDKDNVFVAEQVR